MMKIASPQSAAACLLVKTDRRVWERGEVYAGAGKVQVIHADDKNIEARVAGTESYQVRLGFPGRGIGKQCSCYYARGGQAQHAACKHMVAVALIWDRLRGQPGPGAEQIAQATIPSPDNSYRQLVKAVYADPLHADLDLLRTLADAPGCWSRPHSHLPEKPPFKDNPNLPLDLEEAKTAFRKIAQWRHRPSYDPYFCAGEMMAAFCEILRSIRMRLDASETKPLAEILLAAMKFHTQLVFNYLDSSDGVQVFSGSHLEDLCVSIKQKAAQKPEDCEVKRLLKEYEIERDR